MSKKSFINMAQASCLRLYAKGDFEHLLESKTAEEFEDCFKNAGDTLLTFLMVELSASEDCESLPVAIDRVVNAIEDLKAVQRALETDLESLGNVHVRLTLTTREGRVGQCVLGSKDQMVWDNEDGDDETVEAMFESFRYAAMGLQFIDEVNVTGDEWRAIESVGDRAQITADVREGVELQAAVKKQAQEVVDA